MQVSGQVSGSAGGAAMLQQMRDRMFARADRNGDGGLSLDEFKAMAKRPPREAGSAGPPAGPAGAAAGPAARTDRAAAAFSALDTNGDGKLSTAELEQGRRSRHAGAASREGLAALLGVQEGAQGACRGQRAWRR
ncbi:EF-hand domain-containing protein [Paeniroseomonas aquatica]|uniref:EF-hand domain-containing protein n=1 Tax=Paeniroseomonas aquatica TaxID=373043 RepID=UPI00360B2D66